MRWEECQVPNYKLQIKVGIGSERELVGGRSMIAPTGAEIKADGQWPSLQGCECALMRKRPAILSGERFCPRRKYLSRLRTISTPRAENRTDRAKVRPGERFCHRRKYLSRLRTISTPRAESRTDRAKVRPGERFCPRRRFSVRPRTKVRRGLKTARMGQKIRREGMKKLPPG